MCKMKKIVFLFVLLLSMAACTQRPSGRGTQGDESPVQSVQNQEGMSANNGAVDTVSPQARQANMEEVRAYLKECGAFFIATVDDDQPRVRPFGVSEIIDGRLYIMTGKVKDVYKQMAKNGKFEICALKPSGSEWMRLSGTLVNDETLAVKEEFLNRNEGLKTMYKADDGNMAVLQVTNATARFCSFSSPERRTRF